MKIAVVNSDQRMQQVYFNLSHDFDTVLLNEFTDFNRFSIPDVVVLPVKGMDMSGTLHANGKEIRIPASFWEKLDNHHVVFAGIEQPFLNQLPVNLQYYMHSPDLIARNARYTAEGVLLLLMDNTQHSILDMQVDIIGYGACGKEIAMWLQSLGVRCRIIRRSCEEDDTTVSINTWKQVACGDVIINTAPAFLIDQELMSTWDKKPLIIDIATGDVMDYPFAANVGIRIIKAGNLPNMVAHISGGNAIANYVRGVLHG